MLHYVLNISQIYLHEIDYLFFTKNLVRILLLFSFFFSDEKSNQGMVKSFTKGVASGFQPRHPDYKTCFLNHWL